MRLSVKKMKKENMEEKRKAESEIIQSDANLD